MSASKNKIVRKQQIEAGTDKKSLAAAKAEAERRKSNIKYIVVGVVVVLFIAFILIFNSALPSTLTTAVTIDGVDYSVAQMNYYYSAAYNNFYNTYYTYISYGMFFDTETSLADQMYDEEAGTTWRQYFLDSAVSTMEQVQVLCDAAEAAGFTLPEEDQATYDESIATFETAWANYGYSNLEQYINLNYGKGVTMDMIKEELYRSTIASAYAQSVYEGFEYTTDDLTAYYTEHADELDVIDYAYYMVTDETVDAQAIADAVNGTSEEEFNTYLTENFDGAEATSLSYAGSNLSSVYSEWLLDGARQVGDAAALTSEDDATTTYVVMFLGRDTNDYNTVSFRHVLINADDTDGDGAYSEEELAAAVAEAETLYADWQAGDATEDSFAELANTSSDDTGSNTTGGLYEDVYKNYMVENVNDWIFAEGRQAGDTGIVTNEGSYTGAHILYFVGADDMTYAQSQADTALREEAYEDYIETAQGAVETATCHLGMCGKNH